MSRITRQARARVLPLAALALLVGAGLALVITRGLAGGVAQDARLRGEIYVLAQAGPLNTPAAVAHGELRAGDTLHVSVTAEPASFLTLLYLAGDGRLAVSRALRDDPLPPSAAGWTARFEVDDQPGEERLAAVISRAPLRALPTWVEQANDAGGDAPARLASLRDLLNEGVPAGTYALRTSPRFVHR